IYYPRDFCINQSLTAVQLRISAVLLRKTGRWDAPYADYQSCQCCQRKSVLRPQRYGTMTLILLLAGGDDSCRKKLKTGR
ncbi:hypothetical protein, partial [Bariatricus sp. HCP28S3_D3]|uniref:hypothetical protein n=1 Tax=Bariatricus sp. HCP28S3_D3 TaxID=3438901 RepID=UPI003F8CA928